MICKDCKFALADLISDPTAPAPQGVRVHLASCPDCTREFDSMKSTFALLDHWQAPEPSAYFNQKLSVRLREEQGLAPAGWFEKLKLRLLLNTGRQMRPALAGGLALLLVAGGGAVLDLSTISHPHPPASATVQDLQILDKNEQAIQTMDQLLQPDSSGNDAGSLPSS